MITDERVDEIREQYRGINNRIINDLLEYIDQQKAEIEKEKFCNQLNVEAVCHISKLLDIKDDEFSGDPGDIYDAIEQLNINIKDAFYQKEMAEVKNEKLEKENAELKEEIKRRDDEWLAAREGL